MRIGVTDLAAQIKTLNDLGVDTGEPVVIADMVRVVDVPDPDGNEVVLRAGPEVRARLNSISTPLPGSRPGAVLN